MIKPIPDTLTHLNHKRAELIEKVERLSLELKLAERELQRVEVTANYYGNGGSAIAFRDIGSTLKHPEIIISEEIAQELDSVAPNGMDKLTATEV